MKPFDLMQEMSNFIFNQVTKSDEPTKEQLDEIFREDLEYEYFRDCIDQEKEILRDMD